MENNYVDTLEYLLKIKSEKKNKEPSKIERDQFCAAWVKLTVSEGYSERVERYLYNGVSYCGARPFKEYIDQIENKEQGLLSFFTGKMYGINAETTFRLMVHLFALLLNDKKTADLTSAVIMGFPHACLNKGKKRLGNIEAILLKYFFTELDPNVHLIPLDRIGIKEPVLIIDFISAMETALKNIDPNGLSKKKVANMAKVQQWIEEYQKPQAEEKDPAGITSNEKAYPAPKDISAEAVVPVVPVSTAPAAPSATPAPEARPAVTEKKPVTSEEPGKVVPVAPDEEHPADMTAYLMDLLGKAGKAVSAIKSENVQQKTKIDAVTHALEGEQDKLHRANQQMVELQDTIAGLRQKLSTSEGDVFVLRQTVEQQNSVIAEKDAEIAERIKMEDVLGRDRSKQADEALQRMASKIRFEYRDFVDALDVPMSCDLGENLRLQLQSIFDILEKGGMKIK